MIEKRKKNPELVAPGGSFLQAAHTLMKGADAVYAGLTEFSARARASNLTVQELRKLKSLAASKGKKIYVALNTVIRECELDRVLNILFDLTTISIDAVIIQDAGLLNLVNTCFPGLRVHASTQMAIHNSSGVSFLRECGVKRVILARELALKEIEKIRSDNPDIELEVFIHGAMCYGFSGLCLASSRICGRSGNRGDCAQICRNWFHGHSGKAYYFSMNDLALEERVKKLRDAGIDAFKIEGRMKSPEYAGYTVLFYKSILEKGLSPEKEKYRKLSKICFTRKQTDAYFNNSRGEKLINRDFSSHIGLYLGKVLRTKKGQFLIKLAEPLACKDGIMFFNSLKDTEPFKFGVKRIQKNGRNLFFAKASDSVWVDSPVNPAVGQDIYKISQHDLLFPVIREGAFQAYKFPLNILVEIKDAGCLITTDFNEIYNFLDNSQLSFLTLSMDMNIQKAEKPGEFEQAFTKLLQESDDSLFKPGIIKFINYSKFEDNSIFITPKALKSMKNEWYRALNTRYNEIKIKYTEKLRTGIAASKAMGAGMAELFLSNPGSKTPEFPAPFMVTANEFSLKKFPLVLGWYFFSLNPVIFDEDEYLQNLLNFLEQNSSKKFAIGLNNFAHISWVKKIAELGNATFFVDYGLYCANSSAFSFFVNAVPELVFICHWLEGDENDYNELLDRTKETGVRLTRINKKFKPPLYLSRACFRNHSLGQGCPRICKKDFKYGVSQSSAEFMVVVKNCMTYLFEGTAPEEFSG